MSVDKCAKHRVKQGAIAQGICVLGGLCPGRALVCGVCPIFVVASTFISGCLRPLTTYLSIGCYLIYCAKD